MRCLHTAHGQSQGNLNNLARVNPTLGSPDAERRGRIMRKGGKPTAEALRLCRSGRCGAMDGIKHAECQLLLFTAGVAATSKHFAGKLNWQAMAAMA